MRHLRTQVTQDLGGASCLKVAKTVHSFFITCSTDGLRGGDVAELRPRSAMKSSTQPASPRLLRGSGAPAAGGLAVWKVLVLLCGPAIRQGWRQGSDLDLRLPSGSRCSQERELGN